MRKQEFTNFSFARFSGALVVGVALAAPSAWAQNMPDAQVEANVLRALAGAPQLATQSIKTTTVYGTVTLSGSVADESTRVLAETLASKAAGVQKVVDELTLASDAPASASAGAVQGAPQQDGGQVQGSQTQASSDQAPVLLSDGTVAPPPGTDQLGQQTDNQQAANPAPAPNQGQAAPNPAQTGQYPPQPAGQYPPQNNGQYPNQGQTDPYGPAGPPPQGPYGSPAYRQPYRGVPPSSYAQAPGAQEGGRAVTITSGALVRVRLVEGLTSKRIKAGTIFDGTVLNDVIADGEVAIPRGASVQGTIVESSSSGAVGGKGQLALQLTSVSLGGKNYPIISDTWTHYGRDKTGQTVGNAIGLGAFGALIGAVAGGGAGAAIGAAAGGATGVGLSAATGRDNVVVPPEAILSFHLVQPATVTTVSQAEMDRLGYGVQQSNLQRRQPPPPYGYYARPVYPYPAPYPY